MTDSNGAIDLPLTRREAVLATGLLSAAVLLGCGEGGPDPGDADVIVIGAGIAGLAAAAELRRKGLSVLVLEARDRIGGRVHTVDDFGPPIDLGAAWIHDRSGNPLTSIAEQAGATLVPTDYDRVELADASGRPVGRATMERAQAACDRLLARLEEAGGDLDDTDPLGPELAGLMADSPSATRSQAEVVDWLLGVEFPLDLGADPGELSIAGWLEGEGYEGGGDALIREGAGVIVEQLAKGTRFRLGTPVAKLTQADRGVVVTTASGEEFGCDACVVTVPLGVLQSGTIEFDPAPPLKLADSIDSLSMGTLDKVILRYPERWWDSGATQVGTIGESIGRTVSAFNVEPVTGRPMLVAFVGARHARELERSSDDAFARSVIERLTAGFGSQAADPEQVRVTRWSTDRWSLGSYSHLPPGASPADRELLGEPWGRVVLAGEHTSVERPSTMDGALRSGRRAAATAARLVSGR